MLKFINCLSLVIAERFLVETNNRNSLLSSRTEIVDSITINNMNILVMEFESFPYNLFEFDDVKSIERDNIITLSEQFISYPSTDLNKMYYVQEAPPWNLDRIDQRGLPLNDKYYYLSNAGVNVDVYIVDTGIDIKHPEFTGRARWGGNFIDNIDTDCNSHGTHVAGTVGSKSYGVAKNANLIAVKVLDCNGGGTYSGILKGFEYIITEHKKNKRASVINMSLGGPKSDIIDKAMNNLLSSNVHIVVAAGNENSDACNSSPASHPGVITVGATTKEDTKAYFSNWGSCVNILSPGTSILSTVPDNKTKILQGTSMASPAVAGVLSVILSQNPLFTPETLKKILNSVCTKGAIKGFSDSTPNCLVYSLSP
jgi:subtilisin family serine protease